jgi:hypothetical protein
MLTLSRFADRGGAPRRSPVGLPVAEVSAHFLPPWSGKFAPDRFHPSQDGYRDWARALLATVPRSPPQPNARHTRPHLRPMRRCECNPCCYDSTD